MGRWKLFAPLGSTHGDGEGCPVCDHPFGHLNHACISSIGAVTPAVVNLPSRLPETVVA